MWKKISYFSYRKENNLTTELNFKLNLNKDKSKQIDIQISPNSTLQDILNNFKKQIESQMVKIDPELQEYKFVLKDKSNKYNEFILKNNILIYNYIQEEKYELYYLPYYKKKSYTISIALKDKNSLQHFEQKDIEDFTQLDNQLITNENNVFKYSKKYKKFVQINICLYTDSIEIEKIKSLKPSRTIPLLSITEIKEIKDITYKAGFSTMVISSSYQSKVKKFILAFNSSTFNKWFLLIFNQIHQFCDSSTFMDICKNLTNLNRKKTSSIIQLANKFNNIKGILSLNFSKNIFYEFYDNNDVKELYDLLIQLRDNILDKKKLIEEKEVIEKMINIIETNKEFNFEQNKKNMLDILKQNLNKINQINEKDEVNKNDNKYINESMIYSYIDHLIIKYFEPFYNKIIDSKLKNEFMNKIFDFILKSQNKQDYKFYDFDSDIKELIITN